MISKTSRQLQIKLPIAEFRLEEQQKRGVLCKATIAGLA